MKTLNPFPTSLMFIGGTLLAFLSGVILSLALIYSPSGALGLVFFGLALFANGVLWLRVGFAILWRSGLY